MVSPISCSLAAQPSWRCRAGRCVLAQQGLHHVLQIGRVVYLLLVALQRQACNVHQFGVQRLPAVGDECFHRCTRIACNGVRHGLLRQLAYASVPVVHLCGKGWVALCCTRHQLGFADAEHGVHHLVRLRHAACATGLGVFRRGTRGRFAVAHELHDFGAERLLVEAERFVAAAFEREVRLDFHDDSFGLKR